MKYLIAGLGNIGPEYVNTRHNIGFNVADAFVEERKAVFECGRLANIAKFRFRGKGLIVIKPSTYMNLSGKAIRYWLTKENIPIQNLLVVVDDLDLPFGTIRLRKKGGPGSHNGLIDIVDVLQTTDFARLRFGIGSDFSKGQQIDYVLGKWSQSEDKLLAPLLKKSTETINSFVINGPDRAMNIFNTQ
jgi:peptidyl-tRNA hydrolase, PTH1 family